MAQSFLRVYVPGIRRYSVAREAGHTDLVVIAPPVGFYEIPTLSARAAWVAQKPVQAFCATSDSVWQAYIASIGGPPSGVTSAFGYTPTVGGDSTYLAPATCATITSRLQKRRVSLPTLGAALAEYGEAHGTVENDPRR